MLYVKEKRPEYCGTERGKTMSFGEIMRELADKWKSLTTEERIPYIEASNVDKQRHDTEKEEMIEAKVREREEGFQPQVVLSKEGMPKKPMSAYLSFANDVREKLRRKKPSASVSDIMKAVSIEWTKLKPEEKDDYFQKARVNRAEYYNLMRQWEAKNGPKQTGLKQLRDLEEKRKKSVISFMTHGMEFGKAAEFSSCENPETFGAS